MRHFYIRAMQLKAVGGKPDEVIDANLLKAVGIAERSRRTGITSWRRLSSIRTRCRRDCAKMRRWRS